MEYNSENKPTILPFKGIFPDIHPTVFMCAGVRIIGDVTIGAESSVWFNSVIRGDVHYIKIGERTNIQDMCMLHVTNGKFPLNIGNDVIIGHSVNIHGCTLEDRCLIGIGANLLDGCRVSSYSFVAAGALVREGFTVPEGCLVAGVPAKVVRRLKDEEIEMISYISGNYLKYVADYRQNLGE